MRIKRGLMILQIGSLAGDLSGGKLPVLENDILWMLSRGSESRNVLPTSTAFIQAQSEGKGRKGGGGLLICFLPLSFDR